MHVLLRFYVTEKQRHKGELLHEWLLAEAKKLGMPGGSAFRAIAGFGRHGHMHEDTFFELAGELPVQVEFVLEEQHAETLLEALRGHQLNLFYVRQPVMSGVL